MLSIGFYPDMKEVQRYLPRHRIHTSMFSATYPPHVLKLAGEFLTEPSMLSLSQKEVHVAEVQHLFCQSRPMDKDRVLVRLLETENPASAIIFCNTKANVHYITGVLQGFGYNADELSADLSQARREAVLDKDPPGQPAISGGHGRGRARHRHPGPVPRLFCMSPGRSRELHPPCRTHGPRRGRRYGHLAGGHHAAHGAGTHRPPLPDSPARDPRAHGRGCGRGGRRARDHPAGGPFPQADRSGEDARGPLCAAGARAGRPGRGRRGRSAAGHAGGCRLSGEPGPCAAAARRPQRVLPPW